jgi:RHS repeat-associated protein
LDKHLGNSRVMFCDVNNDGLVDESEIIQEDHYYPFGLKHEGYGRTITQGENFYQYNGKELNEDFGLDMYDYGARFYDASVGPWFAIDPLAEKYVGFSPFNYVVNNPVLLLDPDGMKWVNPYEEKINDLKNKKVTKKREVKRKERLLNEYKDKYNQVEKMLIDFEKNDKALYDYIDNLEIEGGTDKQGKKIMKSVDTHLFVDNSFKGENGQGGETKWNPYTDKPNNKYKNKNIVTPMTKNSNGVFIGFSVTIYTLGSSDPDNRLANEAGDIMYYMEYNSDALLEGGDNKRVENHTYQDSGGTTRYSKQVEEVYNKRKKYLQDNNRSASGNPYPLKRNEND